MKTMILCAGLALSLSPLVVNAAPIQYAMKKPMKMAATMYECQKCHMKVSAATAKKDGYKDAKDGGKLIPMKAAPAKGGDAMPGMKM